MAEERLEEIRQGRLKKREAILAAGGVPYPAEARRTHTAAEALARLKDLKQSREPVVAAGRITAWRGHGGVAFADLTDESGKLQLQFSQDQMPEEIWARLDSFDIGDFIEATGAMGETKRGVAALLVKEIHMLAKSLRPLPSEWFGLKDPENRFRERVVDLALNKPARDLIKTRAAAVGWLRKRYAEAGFMEVETPILQPLAGGTSAIPFTTYHEALDTDLYLRIAPELYLKRLLVGGFEKVFEIGRIFRNEGMDREHNPEFTMLEAYWAYADYEDLMDFMETLLADLVPAITGSADVPHGDQTLSFTMPFRRERYVDLVSKAIGFDILEEKSVEAYEEALHQRHLDAPKVRTYAKLVDEFFKEVVRPTLVQPTIVYDFPVEVEPLAKQSAHDPRVVERFQVLAAGTELLKAYSELNDPVVQLERFEAQQKDRAAGDREAGEIDYDYVRALEYGMPPAAGVGIGIDRLVWLLGNVKNIRETIAFPLMRSKETRN